MTVCTLTQIPSRSPENTQFQNIEKWKDIDLQPTAPEWHASPARWGPTARALLWCDGKLPQSLGHSNRGHNWLQTTRCHPWMLIMLRAPHHVKYIMRRKCVSIKATLGWPSHHETTMSKLWFTEVISLPITLLECCDYQAKY